MNQPKQMLKGTPGTTGTTEILPVCSWTHQYLLQLTWFFPSECVTDWLGVLIEKHLFCFLGWKALDTRGINTLMTFSSHVLRCPRLIYLMCSQFMWHIYKRCWLTQLCLWCVQTGDAEQRWEKGWEITKVLREKGLEEVLGVRRGCSSCSFHRLCTWRSL